MATDTEGQGPTLMVDFSKVVAQRGSDRLEVMGTECHDSTLLVDL